jgi:tetratricopeptide (TPR) repeat protein
MRVRRRDPIGAEDRRARQEERCLSDSDNNVLPKTSEIYANREVTPPAVPSAHRRPRPRPLPQYPARLPPRGPRSRFALPVRIVLWVAVAVSAGAVILALEPRWRSLVARPSKAVPPVSASEGAGATEPISVQRLRELATRVSDVRREAEQLAARGLIDEAVERLDRERQAAPHNIEIKTAIAGLLFERSRFGEARRWLLEILEAQPRDLEARRSLAMTLMELGQFGDAYDTARWYLEAVPGDLAGRKLAARICLSGGWHEQAVTHLRSIVDARQEDVETRQLLALSYLRLGQHAKAINQFTELIKTSTPDATTYYNLALVYARQQQSRETIDALNHAVEIFGAGIVGQWMGEDDFKPMQDDPLFKTFRAQLIRQQTPDAVTLMPRRPAGGTQEIGWMPEPMLKDVPKLRP